MKFDESNIVFISNLKEQRYEENNVFHGLAVCFGRV